MGFLWIDTSTSPPPVTPYYPPQTPPASGTNSFTDASGEVWLSKTGSAWRRARDVATARIYLASNQTVASGNVQILLSATQFDPLGSFASNAYTVPVAGRYLITGSIGHSGAPATAGSVQSILTTNGVASSYGNVAFFPASAGSWPAYSVQDIQKFNAGDAIALFNWLAAGGPANITVMGDPTRTFLAVHFLDPG